MREITSLDGRKFLESIGSGSIHFVFYSLAQTLGLEKALVRAVQALRHGGGNEWIVLNLEQMINDKPYGLIGGHPVKAVKAFEADGNRKTTQRALATQVDINIEIT